MELIEIENEVIKNNGVCSFDTWGLESRAKLYKFLIKYFKEKNVNAFDGKHGTYITYFCYGTDSRGGMHMGSPDSMTVCKLIKNEK